MKNNKLKYILLILSMVISSCSDFFNVDTKNVLDHNDYINAESEMYAGYIGVITKLQKVGDKSIYLTDTKAEMLEPTVNTPSELYSIYNYDDNLSGNSYADPSTYYDVIIACNDYLSKLYDYKESHSSSINMTHYQALISCTLRVKAWVYLNIAKIYGEAVWFDDPLREEKDLSKYPVENLDQVVESCKDLLVKGFDGVNGQLTMSWKEWLDPETATGDSNYRYWDYMTPEYFALYAELCLWSGDYQKTVNILLNAMNTKFNSTVNDATAWMRNDKIGGVYANIWNYASPLPQETVSAIIYDYSKNQTNSLLKHFGSEYPNKYLLRPSAAGLARYSNSEFDPLGGASTDKRLSINFAKDANGNMVVQKYRPLSNPVRTYAYQDDVHIYIYRTADLYFMLAEALNNLGRFNEASALINQGVNGAFPNGGVTWEGFSDGWTSVTPIGNRKYPDKGIRGIFGLGNRTFTEDKEQNDMQILNEMMLEVPCEGRTYPAMIRMARRYNDYNIIADRVCDKYANPEEIRSKILNGGYFIHWSLK